HGARADGCATLDERGPHLPVFFRLQATTGHGCSRNAIIDEDHTVSDKNVVLDDNALADEGVAGYLAATANRGVFLYLDKRPDLAVVADCAPVQIDKIRDVGVRADAHIRGNFLQWTWSLHQNTPVAITRSPFLPVGGKTPSINHLSGTRNKLSLTHQS